MTTALLLIATLLAAFGLAVALVPVAGRIARRSGVVDAPGERKMHEKPMPRLGGIAVWAAFTLVVLIGYFGAPILSGLPWAQTHLATPLKNFSHSSRRSSRKGMAGSPARRTT